MTRKVSEIWEKIVEINFGSDQIIEIVRYVLGLFLAESNHFRVFIS